jgi:hypothetical protein
VSAVGILIGIITALGVNELCDVSPWCARRLIRLSARLRYSDQERRKVRADEFVALLDERPGQLFKLGTALGFLIASLPTWLHHAATGEIRRLTSRRSAARAPWLPEEARLTITNSSSFPVTGLKIATALSALAPEGGLVTVSGTWGAGKTTLANSALAELAGTSTVTYNPWLRSGTQNTSNAMDGLAGQVRATSPDLAAVASALERYLGSLPIAADGAWPQSPRERWARRRLANKLRALSEPVVIALDDIDRMRPDRLRQVFEFVARTVGLPQLVYLMSFDRSVVGPLLPPGLLERCAGKLQVELAYGTLRRRSS